MLVGDIVSDGLMLFGDEKKVNEGLRLLRHVLTDMANFDGSTPRDEDQKVLSGDVAGWNFLRFTETYQTLTTVDSVTYAALSIKSKSKGIRILSTASPRELKYLPIEDFNALYNSAVHGNPRNFNNDEDVIKFAPGFEAPNLPELTIRGYAPFSITKLTNTEQDLGTLFGIPEDWQYYLAEGLAAKMSFVFGHDVNIQNKFDAKWLQDLQLMRRANANM